MMNYYECDNLSQSMIKLLLKNRKRFYYKYILNSYDEDEDSISLRDGAAFDLLITDHLEFSNQFTILEGVKTTTKKNHITEYQYNKFMAMKKELMNHKFEDCITVGDLFKTGTFQKEFYWNDTESWLNCKAKLDWLSNDNKLIIDIKTTNNIEGIKYDIFKYGYDIQVAMYKRAVKQILNVDADFVFIFVCKNVPYNVVKVKLSQESLDNAIQKLEHGFYLYTTYKLNNEWQYDEPEFLLV